MARHPQSTFGGILISGLVAGTLDIGAAALINHISPVIIMRFIAAGLLGMQSLKMGLTSSALGLVLQWAMSILIAAICILVTQPVAGLRRHWMPLGLAYGVATFFVMNYLVVPLSAIGHGPKFSPERFAENLIAMLVFGLIIAYFTKAAGNRAALGPLPHTHSHHT
ncbi:MAG TPA: hypothetical protein VGL55_16915 [Steroidobacteraceae bacterium]|jgi:uncharacterized membrane protein YagU involved in acid resistance